MRHQRAKGKPARRSQWYGAIGQYYDTLWDGIPRIWTEARRRLLDPILPQVRQVCELGCGTGTSSIEFARGGLKVFALDYSGEMCRITREKAREEGLDVWVGRADMRSFRLPQQVDLVTSEWGVINHLPRRAELGRTFRAVARALRPGGYFYFDLHQRRFYEDVFSQTVIADKVNAGSGREFFAAQRGGFDRSRDIGWTEITLFVCGSGGRWERRRERIEEIYWPHGEIVRHLRRAGFHLLYAFDFVNPDTPRPKKPHQGLRTMYLAVKKGA